jgi:hypothetical protein
MAAETPPVAVQAFVEVVIDPSLAAPTPLPPGRSCIREGFAALKAKPIEAASPEREIIASHRGGFVEAVYHAFNNHIPLCFGPDDLWTLIVQGVSRHVELNAEALRDKFVNFEGKKVLRIRRDDFVLGDPLNDWAGCFSEWSQMVADNIGPQNTTALVPTFSTTGKLEKALHELALMDCVKSYFKLRCRTLCGISKVKLLGTRGDWDLLLEKVEGLREYELGWWIDQLMPVLRKIQKTYTGEEVDKIFWYTIYKQWSTHGSGASTYVNGWITTFFPYVKGRRRQCPSLEELRSDVGQQPGESSWGRGPRLSGTLDHEDVPNSLSATPFVWEYLGAEIPMTIYGGFAGCEMDGEYIRPVLAWAVGKDKDGVLKQLVERHGQPISWTTAAVCEFLCATDSVARKSLEWFRRNGVTGQALCDRSYHNFMEADHPEFDHRRFDRELSKLRS